MTDLSRLVRREVVLVIVLSATAMVVFALTQWAAHANRAQQSRDATLWFERGRERLAEGRSAAAVSALERAVGQRPDEWDYVKALADALVADGRVDAARRVLSERRRQRPDDVAVNTQLARLEAAHGEYADAVEYYESALQGRWQGAGPSARLDLRRELIQYELRHGPPGAALTEALVLAANLPDEPDAHLEAGRLFTAAGDSARALDHFERALRFKPDNVEARAGVVASAFALGDYARVLARARGLADQPSRQRAATAAAVIANDPLESGLSFAERERRLGRAVEYAAQQLALCRERTPMGTPLAERSASGLSDALRMFRADLTAQRLRDSPAVVERGLRLAYRALDTVRQRCSLDDPRADALVRIARRRGAAE